MFLDYILESGYYESDYEISEETRELVDSLDIVDFSESALSPFELMERSIYEFVQENVHTMETIVGAEIKYLKEMGEEPLWEASDSESLFQRIIKALTGLLSKIGGAFKKAIDNLQRKIMEKGEGKIKEIADKASKLDAAALKGKEIKLVKYNPQIGISILEKNKNPQSRISTDSEFKDAFDTLEKGGAYEKKIDAKNFTGRIYKIILDGSEVPVPSADGGISDIKKSLHDKMAPAATKVSPAEALETIKLFTKDTTGSKAKTYLKKLFNDIKTCISKMIDMCKSYSKKSAKADKKKRSAFAGVLTRIVNTYSSTISLIYSQTSHVVMSQYFQAMSLAKAVARVSSGNTKKNGKEATDEDIKSGTDDYEDL